MFSKLGQISAFQRISKLLGIYLTVHEAFNFKLLNLCYYSFYTILSNIIYYIALYIYSYFDLLKLVFNLVI